ncbi:hypothetical protein BWK59_00645 [Flavobacterium davisii]|uniref:Uncharacterized protein n=1 Tax=Flavobacterium davisii TaxID=2906077 RepID=A0A246GLQ6_9FLAO|nr:hypothetical protein [Flavobacterium davisii]OWP85280.1 hypothetical protein BWK59_00645 [Flavobacterium davisii]
MLNTCVPTPVIHVYQITNKGKYTSTKHFELVEVKNKQAKLSSKINIQVDRGFAKSMPKYWLKIRESNKWVRLTGLFKTEKPNLFKGDKGESNSKEDLIIAKFEDQQDLVIIYYFEGYFTSDLNRVLKCIET